MMAVRLLIRIFLFLSACGLLAFPAFAQQTPRSDDVVRVNTELVQTDLTVFDKQGNFVDNLKKDQFVLKVDGKPRNITFFDRIAAGSRNEEVQLAAARGEPNISGKPGLVPLDRGRIVMFFIDDLHLSPSSLVQTRKVLKRFVDHEMRQNDAVSIASVSGQLGFLQQLTDNKTVLTAAIDRLKLQQSIQISGEYPPMSEYQAQQIEQHDEGLLNFFIEAVLKENANLPRQIAAQMVQSRASQVLEVSSSSVTRTMGSLKSLIDITKPLPGRKLVFFISEGFFLDRNHSDNYDRLQRITSAAARSGAVIYSIDARGLTTGLPDASQNVPADPTGRLQRAAMGEVRASQDAMNALAVDTGGRAIFNTNAFPAAVAAALKETSVYYLLAWRPENEEQRNSKFRRIEVSVAGRPELVVRFRHGFGEAISPETARHSKEQTVAAARKTPADELGAALRAAFPASSLPVSISLNFLDTAQNGATLTTSVKVDASSLSLKSETGTDAAFLDIAGMVLSDQGKPVSSFNTRLTIRPAPNSSPTHAPENVFYNDFTLIKPGLYQVRVAAIDEKQRTTGSAFQWIEIPNLQSRDLIMSSLIIGERKSGTDTESVDPSSTETQTPAELSQVVMNVDHRFSRSSYLRFLTFIYNAATALSNASSAQVPANGTGNKSAGPDLAVQVQVFRDDEPVITTPLHRIETQGVPDLQRVPYAADVMLGNLRPGAYVLQVTIIDRLAKSSTSQRLNFEVN